MKPVNSKKHIVIGIPAIDLHGLTGESLSTTASYVADKTSVTFVIIDNASEKPYKKIENNKDIKIDIIRNETNYGYYYPLLQLYKKYPKADYIGLMHNDAIVYQQGWDDKIREAFIQDKKLAAVGLFGWEQISQAGRNENPLGNIYWPFPVDELGAENAKPVFSQYHKRVFKVTPAVSIDSLFMVFPRKIIPMFKIDTNIALSHLDKTWCLQMINKGYHVAVLGIPFRHEGSGSNNQKVIENYKKWFDKRWQVNAPIEYINDMSFFEAQVLLVDKFRDKIELIPCRIDDNYKIIKI